MPKENSHPNRKQKRERKPGLFTDKYIKSLEPETEMYQVREGRGFAIRVLPSGTKTWYYIYNFKGKRRQLNLGNYSDISLKDAHSAYSDARDLVKKGIDPMAPPKPTPEFEALEEMTVAAMKVKYVEHIKTQLTPRSVTHQDQRLEKHLIPVWGNRPVRSIRRPEAIMLIEEIAKSKRGAARNVVMAGRAMFEFGLDREFVDINPFHKVGRSVPQATAKSRERALSKDEIRKLWKELQHGYGSSDVRRVLQLILLLGQRPGEVAVMRFEHIDGDWWTIPKNETKIGRNPKIDEKMKFDHRVFLPPLAKKLIGTGTGYVFSPRGTPLSETALSGHVRREVMTKTETIRKEKYYGLPSWTPHDLRRTMATRLAEDLDADHRHIDAILGHIIPGVLGTYVRTKYDKKKQHWALAWEKLLLETVMQQEDNPSEGLTSLECEVRRILSNDEISFIWSKLSAFKSEHSARVLKFILVTGQEVGACAALHRDQIVSDSTGNWWILPEGNKIYLAPMAMSLIGDSWSNEGYAFAPRGNSIKIATISYHVLKQSCFGLPKWTPFDLRLTASAKIREFGAPVGVVDAIEQGSPINQWELRHWLDRWAEHLGQLVN